MTNLELVRGDVVRILTGNGGGLGEPSSRQLTRIHEDLRNGYITSDEARAYGVRADDAEFDTHIA